MLISTIKLQTLSVKLYHILPLVSHFTHKPSNHDTINPTSTLIKSPNWEQNKHLRSLISHMSPESACKVISLHSNNIQLCVKFFKLSTVTEALRLINFLDDMRDYGFGISYPCYSTLLMCLSKLKLGLTAFSVYKRMVKDGFVLGLIDYTTLVNALCKSGFVRAAEMFVSRVVQLGYDVDVHIATSLVLGYCTIGDLIHACQVFDEMSERDGCGVNEVTFTVLIHGLCEAGRLIEAFELKEQMAVDGCRPSTRTYTVLIKGICDMGLTDKAMCLLDEMVKNGCDPNAHTFTILIDGLCREGKIDEANGMFRKMMKDGLTPSSVTFNALINGYCKQGRVVSGFELLAMMEKRNSRPNIRTYNELMEGLCRIEGKLDQANGLLGLMMKKVISPDEVTFTALINGYCKNGKIENAVMFLDTTVGSKNLTLTGPHMFNSLIDAFSKDNKFGLANAMIGKMLKCCVTPSVVTYTILIDGFCQTGNINRSLEVFELMKRCNCAPNVYTFTALVNGFCQCGSLEEAVELFKTMCNLGVSPNVITYTILIRAYVKSGDLEHAFEILNDMVKNKCQPNFETLSALLEGLIISKSVTDSSFTVFKEMGSTHVVEFLEKAEKYGVGVSDIYSFLIMGLYKVGRILEGDELVQEMVKDGYFPDIYVCSHILEYLCKQGKYDDCVVWMKLMFDHGLMPSFGLYCCLVHDFQKEGKIHELQDLMSDYLSKSGVEDRDGVSTYMDFLVNCDEHDECFELLKVVEKLSNQDRPAI
ncbi:hypothetical protein L1987_50669 [Smallanthus sonchifolius]|uniref:Uncharacterized protein n=1 Tax=Smallanthus sonchifolius TaxID=185202 RepID=A0ACB9ENH3_9ASTR|nr:hypothetical protein L1987_50669 [Smallanthus sonchifolius]